MRLLALLLLAAGLVGGQPPTPPTLPAGAGCTDTCIGAYNNWVATLPITKTFLPLPSSVCEACGKSGSCPTSSNASATLLMQPVCTTTDAVLQSCNTGGARVPLRAGTDTLLCTPVNSWQFVTIVVVLVAFGVTLLGAITMWCMARRKRAFQARMQELLRIRRMQPKAGQLPSLV